MKGNATFSNLDHVIERCDGITMRTPELEGISIDSKLSEVLDNVAAFGGYVLAQSEEILDYLSRSKESRVTTSSSVEYSQCSLYDFSNVRTKMKDYNVFSFCMPTFDVSIYFGKDIKYEFIKHSRHKRKQPFFTSNLLDNPNGLLRFEYVVPDIKDAKQLLKSLQEKEYTEKLEVFDALNSLPDALVSLKEKAYRMSCAYETKSQGLSINKGFNI